MLLYCGVRGAAFCSAVSLLGALFCYLSSEIFRSSGCGPQKALSLGFKPFYATHCMIKSVPSNYTDFQVTPFRSSPKPTDRYPDLHRQHLETPDTISFTGDDHQVEAINMRKRLHTISGAPVHRHFDMKKRRMPLSTWSTLKLDPSMRQTDSHCGDVSLRSSNSSRSSKHPSTSLCRVSRRMPLKRSLSAMTMIDCVSVLSATQH